MSKVKMALIKGFHHGSFVCIAEYGFNPLTCIAAAPKIKKLFLYKSLEESAEIAKKYGFSFFVTDTYDR